MLSSFRNLSKSKVGTVILALFVVMIFASFALADISGFGGGAFAAAHGTLVEAGDEEVTDRDFTHRDGARARRRAPAESRGDLCLDRGQCARADRAN